METNRNNNDNNNNDNSEPEQYDATPAVANAASSGRDDQVPQETDNERDQGQTTATTTTTATRNAAISNTSDQAPAEQRPVLDHVILVSQGMYSDDLDMVSTCLRELSRVLEEEANPETHLLVIQDDVPRFVELLQYDHRPDIQAPVCDILTNLVDRTIELRTRIMTAGAGPAFIRLLYSTSDPVLCAAVQGLSSIATWGLCRLADVSDYLIEHGVLLPLAHLACRRVSEDVLEGVCKCLTHIFNLSSISLPPEVITTCFLAIKHLLRNGSHSVELAAYWSLSAITNGRDDYTQTMIDLGVLEPSNTLVESYHSHLLKLIDHLQTVVLHIENQEISDTAVEVIAEYLHVASSSSSKKFQQKEGDQSTPGIGNLVESLHSSNMSTVVGSVRKLYILSLAGTHRVTRCIHNNDISRLVELLQTTARPAIQTWITIFISDLITRSTLQLKYVQQAQAYTVFIQQLNSTNAKLVHATVRVVAVIASVGPRQRNMLVDRGVIQPLLSIVEGHIYKQTLMETVSLCLYCIFQWSAKPLSPKIRTACLPAIRKLLMQRSCPVVLNAASVLAVMTKQRDEFCRQKVVTTQILLRLLQIAHRSDYDEDDILRPILTAMTNIVIGNGDEMHVVADRGVSHALLRLMQHSTMKEYALSAAVDLTATNNRCFIQMVIESGWTASLLSISSDQSMRQEASLRILYNITRCCPVEFVTACGKGFFNLLISILHNHTNANADVTKMAMDILWYILQAAKRNTTRYEVFDELLDSQTGEHIISHLHTLRALDDQREISDLAIELTVDYHIAKECHDDGKATGSANESAR